jgi:hypothetical protein
VYVVIAAPWLNPPACNTAQHDYLSMNQPDRKTHAPVNINMSDYAVTQWLLNTWRSCLFQNLLISFLV